MRSFEPAVRTTHFAVTVVLFALAASLAPIHPASAGSFAGAWVTPNLASANSCRWLRLHVTWDPGTESIAYINVSGFSLAPSLPAASVTRLNGFGSLSQMDLDTDSVTTSMSGNWGDMYVTLGPFCGSSNIFNERIADYPYVIGYLYSPGSSTALPANTYSPNIHFAGRFYKLSDGKWDDAETTADVGYQTVSDNDDFVEWWTRDPNGVVIDPIAVGPVEVIADSGAGSSTYTFRVRYKTGLYSGLNQIPRWRSSDPLAGGGTFIDRSLGYANVRSGPDGWTGQHNWIYGRTTDPWLDQTGYNRAEYNDRGVCEPRVLLVIDGQTWAPHHMVPENPADTDYTDGAVYRYTVLPTDYENFVDNLFLLPFDLPGSDTWDYWATRITGRPASNNYVSFSAGPHTYEFWATDDYAPVRNRAWVQVGWPGNDCHVEYVERVGPEPRAVDGLRSAVQRGYTSVWNEQKGNAAYTADAMRRFGDISAAAPDPYGYTYESHAGPTYSPTSRKFPNVNPVLTAHPFFGQPGQEGGISTDLPAILGGPGGTDQWAGGFQGNDIPNNTYIPGPAIGALPNPFTPESGAGPNPPHKYTNDDTILPNYANIWQETDPTPFRGGKWTDSTKFTVRVNYWHSDNEAPRRIQTMIRKRVRSATGVVSYGSWFGYTMEKAVPADTDYTNGCIYQYQTTPDQLPTQTAAAGGGKGDYEYYFVTNDGTREAMFPRRPDAATMATGETILDPADSGFNPTNTGQSYYWFRVNNRPTLSNSSVTPPVGQTGTGYVYRVKYTDPDGAVLATSPQGDKPFQAEIVIDLFGDQYGQARVVSIVSGTELTYATASGNYYPDDQLVGSATLPGYLVFQDGLAVRREFKIVGNTGATITVEPIDLGLPTETDLTDAAAAVGDLFHVAQWRTLEMAPADVNDTNYTATGTGTPGADYVFDTATNIELEPGTHFYYFQFADDWGGWLYPDRNDVRVEGEYVRYPNAGAFEGPTVQENSAPELSDFRFKPDGDTTFDCSTATPVTFSVTYTDAENDPPSFISLAIDGTPTAPGRVLALSPADTTDTVYSDGAVYQSAPTQLSEGRHIVRGQASDGEDRYPPGYAADTNPLPYEGPEGVVSSVDSATGLTFTLHRGGAQVPASSLVGLTVRMLNGLAKDQVYPITANTSTTITVTGDLTAPAVAADDLFILSGAPGPNVAPNKKPVLSFPANDNDLADAPGLNPDRGLITTSFTYTVIYTDDDEYPGVKGNTPSYVSVVIDGNPPQAMTQVDATDNDYTTTGGGAVFQYTVSGLAEATPHTYYFIASDGLDTARLPALSATPNRFDGPVVDQPPLPPSDLSARDTPNDNGGSIDLSFSASPHDGGGPNDVDEYHIYRSLTATFTGNPVLVVKANDYSNYSTKDTTAKTGLVTGTKYYYTVRAYSGDTIDASGDGVPDTTGGVLDEPILADGQSVISNIEGPVSAVDNIAPAAPSALTATDPGLGGTIDLTWTKSPDDGAGVGDVTTYRLYRNTTGTAFAGTPVATIAKGTTSYQDATAVDGTPYYYVLRAFDGTQESADSNVVGPVTSTDANGPVVTPVAPLAGDTNVATTTSIAFDVTDTGAGVDQTSLVMQVNGTTVTPSLTAAGDTIHVTYTPATAFAYLTMVTVAGSVSDTAVTPNVTTYSYQFTITAPPTYSISGTVLDKTGAPMAGVTVTAGVMSASTNAAGAYTITGLAVGTYTVKPTRADTAFVPESQTVSVAPSRTAINFTGEPGYDITGTVTDASGAPMIGVSVSDGTHETVTNAAGQYAILDIRGGTYTVVPQLAGYEFTPASTEVALPGAGAGNVVADFAGDVERFSISGSVRDTAGNRLSGVAVTARNNAGAVAGTATTAGNGAYSLRDLVAGLYTVTPTLAGYVFEPESREVNMAGDVANTDFVAVQLQNFSIATGKAMSAFPVTPNGSLNPASYLPLTVADAQMRIGRYSSALPAASPYLFVTRASTVNVDSPAAMLPGRGFWTLNTTGAAVPLQVPGDPISLTSTFSVALLKGWNMIGNPFAADMPWSKLNITPGQAVRDYGWAYDPATNGYQLVTDMAGLGVRSTVASGEGFWLWTDSQRTLTITGVNSAEVGAPSPTLTLGTGDYLIPVIARGTGCADTSSVAGVVGTLSAPIQIANPPAMSPYVDVYFVDANGARLACDVRTAAAQTQSWRVAVASDVSEGPVELALPDLSRIPADLNVTLRDETTGKTLYARTMGRYSFTPGDEGIRYFALTIAPRAAGGLVVGAASAKQTGNGVAIAYTLSQPASVTVTVTNMAGRPVWTQTVGAATSGVSTVAWNLHGTNGTLVPAGRYLVSIRAAAESGQVAQTVASVQVSR